MPFLNFRGSIGKKSDKKKVHQLDYMNVSLNKVNYVS